MKRFLIIGGSSLLLLLGILIGAVYGSARTANANAHSTTSTASTSEVSASRASSATNDYCTQFQKDLASKLKVTPEQLKSAESSAASDTIDQMVKDGKITKAQADKIKARLGNATNCQFKGKGGNLGGVKMQKLQQYLVAAEAQVAKGLTISAAELTSQLQAGKSLHDIATAHKVSDPQLKTLLNNAIKSELTAAVSAGDVTQAQADMVKNQLSSNSAFLDRLINGHKGQEAGGAKSGTPIGFGF
ncbi:MAG: hypothetical protein NVSMB54_06990 [Ktedonobacteraceae bacterium]